MWARALRKTLTPMPALCQGKQLSTPACAGWSVQLPTAQSGLWLSNRCHLRSLEGTPLLRWKASKDRSSKLLSHICGTRNCCNVDHIVIERPRGSTMRERTATFVCSTSSKPRVILWGGEVLRAGRVSSHSPLWQHNPARGFIKWMFGRKLEISTNCTTVNCGKPLKPILPRL